MIAHGGFLWSRQRSCREHFCPHPSHQNTVTQLDHHKLTGKLSPSTCPRGRKNGFSEHMPGLCLNPPFCPEISILLFIPHVEHAHPLPRKALSYTFTATSSKFDST